MDSINVKVEKMESQLKEWGKKIEELADKADNTGAQLKADYHKQLDEMKAKLSLAQAKFDEFKAAGSEKWDVFKSGIESAWKDFENAFKALKNH
jgi:uncharacterized coiled-coil DUF342 family protein